MKETLIEMLKRHEGFRSHPYKDTEGYLTIGYGRNLDARGISDREGEYLLVNDVEEAQDQLFKWFPIVEQLSYARQTVLVNMTFNLGIEKIRQFRKMWEAIYTGDFNQAADEMLDSRWAQQVGNRAAELAQIMRTG